MSQNNNNELVITRTFNAPRALVTISFAEQQGKTHLTLHSRFASAERREAAAAARFVISWEEALGRLAEQLH